MIESDQRCVRCKNHQHHELWVPGCQVAVCRKELEELKDLAIQSGNLDAQVKINDILDRESSKEYPDE